MDHITSKTNKKKEMLQNERRKVTLNSKRGEKPGSRALKLGSGYQEWGITQDLDILQQAVEF